jgi:hypothetical protein
MPAQMRVRVVLFLAALAAALALAGCGGDSSGSSSSTSSTDPASIAPPDSLFFFEVTRPEGKAAANVEALAQRIAGINDLGDLIVSKLESQALEGGNKLDYGKEVEPWLGEKAAFFPRGYDGDDFSEGGGVLETTDPAEAEQFIQDRVKGTDRTVEKRSYEGVDYYVEDDGAVLGVIGNFLAYAEDPPTFEAMVDASSGDSLADNAKFTDAIAAAPKGSVADVWVDIGGLVQEGGEQIDSETKLGLNLLGIDPEGATALASATPGSDRIVIDLSSDVLFNAPPAADTSFFLSSLPADSVLALASPEAGATFGDAIDRLDREGIPDQDIQPGQLKKVFKEAGLDLDTIASSVADAAFFLEGDSESSLGAAAVLITGGSSGQEMVSDVESFLRSAGTTGLSPVHAKLFDGFMVSSPDLGRQPLVVVSDGLHIVIAYGLRAVTRYFETNELKDDPLFKEATASLGATPISGFARGPEALRLASALISGDDRQGFLEAKPYLSKIEYLALGSESTEDLAKAKLVVGIGK